MSYQTSTQPIPDTLKNFDSLPNSAQIRIPIVKGILSISSASVWRLVAAQKLVAYRLTARTTTFNVGELRAFIKSKGVV